MDYILEQLEDQQIATLKADSTLGNVKTIRTHAGEVNVRLFTDPSYQEGIIPLAPFIFLQYMGRTAIADEDLDQAYRHECEWIYYIGARGFRSTQEGQRGCYSILRSIFDDIHGHWPNYSGMVSVKTPVLSGPAISTTNFNPLTVMQEAAGQDERIYIATPSLVIYSTRYKITLRTY